MNDKRITHKVKSIDIEKLRLDMVSKCDECLESLILFTQSIPIKNIMELMKPNDKKPIQRTLEIHEESVRLLQKQKSLLIKAKTVEELCSVYDTISNGLGRTSGQLDEVLRETINDSRHNSDKIISRCGFLPS